MILKSTTSKWILLAILVTAAVNSGVSKGHWSDHYKSPNQVPDSLAIPIAISPTRPFLSLSGKWNATSSPEPLAVPVQVPGFYDFEGEVTFSRSFQLDSSFVDHRLTLVARGINNRCRVFLNDQFLMSHIGGHTPFSIILPKETVVVPGRNELRIVVDNTLLPRTTLPGRFSPGLAKNYGGIFRDIYILGLPSLHFESIAVKVQLGDSLESCQLLLNTKLRDEIGALAVDQSEVDVSFNVVDMAGQPLSQTVRQKIRLNGILTEIKTQIPLQEFNLWSPENPSLYQIEASLGDPRQPGDQKAVVFGIRRLTYDSNTLSLNNRPFILRGINWHEDYGQMGQIANREEVEREVSLIKQLGANSVRVVGMPPEPYFVEVCAREGLFVFLECPLSFVPRERLNQTGFQEVVGNYYREMLGAFATYPNIAGWGIGIDLQLDHSDFADNMKKLISERSGAPIYVVRHVQELSKSSDGVDLVFYDFTEHRPELPAHARQHSIPIVSVGYALQHIKLPDTELDNFQGAAKGMGEIDIQEQQAYKLNRTLGYLLTEPQPLHIFVSSLADWQTNRPQAKNSPTVSSYLNMDGLFDIHRQKRIAATMVESAFFEAQSKNMSTTLPAASRPNVYLVAGLVVILVFLFNFNRSRRFRANIKRIFGHPHGFYIELRENRKTSGYHTLVLSLVTVVSLAVIFSSILYNYRESFLFQILLELLIVSPSVTEGIIWLTWNPTASLLILAGLLYLFFLLIVLLLKIMSTIFGRPLPISQFFATVFWVTANFLCLLPLVPIYYRVLNQVDWAVVVLGIFFISVVWALARFFRAIKVVLFLTFFRTLLLTVFLAGLTIGGFSWYYDTKLALFDYLPMYWLVLQKQLGL